LIKTGEKEILGENLWTTMVDLLRYFSLVIIK